MGKKAKAHQTWSLFQQYVSCVNNSLGVLYK